MGGNPIASALDRLMSLNTPTNGRPGASSSRTRPWPPAVRGAGLRQGHPEREVRHPGVHEQQPTQTARSCS